jgi:AcrR family transcriptional regulator
LLPSQQTQGIGAPPALRADARRNRERILVAARDVFVEQGADAPLEEVATRAGVGIGTLYRRFPDRAALARAVVLEALTRVVAEARLAMEEEPDAFRALARYMHRALDLRVSAVIPALLGRVPLVEDPEISRMREASARLIEELITRAQTAGALRPDVTFADITLLLVRLARPLPGPVSPAMDIDLAHRQLALYLDGLSTDHERATESLPGPAMTRDDLHALGKVKDRAPG